MFEQTKAGTTLKVLSLEDSVRDYEIIKELLINAGFDFNIARVEKKSDFESCIRNNTYDIIIADFKLPGFDAFGALQLAKEFCPDVPFICVSGSIGEETAIELLKSGAVDYVLKDKPDRLPSAVKRAIIEAKEKAELKLMHEKLKLASENWSSTFDAIQDGIILLDADQNIIEVNKAFLDFVGKSRGEILGQHCWPYVHDTQCPVDNCPFVKATISKNREIMELAIGESNFEVMVDPILNEYNNLTGAVHIVKDITKRKESEKALRENEELLSLFIKNSPIYAYIKEVTPDLSRMLSVSENFVDLTGIKATDMLGKTLEELLPQEIAAKMFAEDLKIVSVGKILKMDEEQNGRNYTSIKFPISMGGKKLLAGYTIDITERKQAEEILARNNRELSILNQFSIKLSMSSSDDNLEAIITKGIKEMTGAEVVVYSEYNPLDHTTTVKEIEMEPGLLEKAIGLIGKQIKKMQSVVPDDVYKEMTAEIIGVKKTLHEMSFGTISHPVSAAVQALLKVDRFIGVAFMLDGVLYGTALLAMKKEQADISREIFENLIHVAAISLRRKKAEESLKESESSLNYAQEIAKMGSWEWDVMHKKTVWSPNYYQIFGLDPAKFEPSFELFRGIIYPEDLTFFDEIYASIFKEKKPKNFELRVVHTSGTLLWIQNFVAPFYEDDNLIKLKGAFIDITERKQTEKMMQDIIEKNPMSIQIVDKGGFTLKVNPAHTALFGAIPPPDFSIFSDSQLSQQGLADEFNRLITGEIVNFPDSCFNPHDLNPSFPDTDIWVKAVAFPLNEKNEKLKQFVIMHENITEHKKYELALKESEEKYRAIFDNVQDVFYQTDLAGILREISPSIKYYSKFTRDEILGKSVDLLYYNKEDRKALLGVLQKNGELKDYELILKTKDNEKLYVSINARLVFDAQGQPDHIDGAIRDISERKRAEEILEKSNKKYLELVDSISDVFFSMDKNLRYTYWNKATEKSTGISAENALGKTIEDLYPENESRRQIKEMYQQVIENKTPRHLTLNFPESKYEVHEITAYPSAEGVSVFVKDITESKMHEFEIIESKKTAERYLNIAAELIMTLDPSGNILMLNESGLKLLGYSQEELIGKNWFKTCVPKGYSSDIAILYKRIMAGEDFKLLESHENTVITKSGEIKTIYFYNNLLSDSEGNNTGLICSGSDITESKKAEEAMRISEERFRKVFEESQIGMAISAANLRFEKVNPAFCKMMGYTSEELTTMNFMSISHPDEVDFGVENIRTLEKGEISFYKVEKRYLTKSGEIIWVNVVVTNVRDKDGKLLYYLAMIEDITERRLAEAKLQASKDYLDKIINTVAYPILVKDEEHRFYLVNNASCEMFGHTKEEILGKTDFDFFPEEQAKEFQIRDKEVFYTGKENNNEEVLTDSNGNIRTLITTKTLYTDMSGKKFIVAIINDISQRKQMELEFIKAKDKAEESDRLKSAFLANMSHEIRTPMNGILGFAELLKEPNLKSEKQQEFISIIEKSGIRLLNIINNLVNISKIESGLMNIYVSEFNINDQIEYIYKFFKPEIEKKGMQFLIKIGLLTKDSVVKSDREKIIAILTNLVGNAIKFTDKGSIELGYSKKANRLEFFVKDTGRGIREEQKEFIFERFRQGSESLSRNYEGAGLGLSISKSYVEMLGGRLWIESKEGFGSTFFFTIPYDAQLIEEVVIVKPVIREGKKIQNKNLKVLIAEDDDISLFLVTLEVKAFAKEILTATSGTDAVRIARNNPDTDLILMDIKMQEMDGYEATRQIRQFNKDVIIIAQTAFGLVGDREKAIAAGCNDYISKPIDLYMLKELINTHFN